jgi:DUF438 domain-containing protein
MWGVDQIIRELMKLLEGAVREQELQTRRVRLIADRLLPQVERMVRQENEILMPMLLSCLTADDWILAAQESESYGLVFNKGITGASNSDAAVWLQHQTGSAKRDAPREEGKVNLPSGRLTVAQLTCMLNTLPTALTFIDSDDVVQYYSEGKHQVFAGPGRSSGAKRVSLPSAPAGAPHPPADRVLPQRQEGPGDRTGAQGQPA